jgi:hypothetical protein
LPVDVRVPLIATYGLFWRADALQPSRSAAGSNSSGKRHIELIGKRGRGAGLKVADFSEQNGLYILYDPYGPYYVGIVGRDRLAKRIRSHHLTNHHAGKWDRFSWFGWLPLSEKTGIRGFHQLRERELAQPVTPGHAVRDIEAMLIRSLDPKANRSNAAFVEAEEWSQVPADEIPEYIGRLRRLAAGHRKRTRP